MIYFKRNEDIIEKYRVTFDKEKIKEVRNEIINNCSFIKHHEYESDYGPRFTKEDIIKNFKHTNTGKKKEYFEETRDIDLFSYDEYIPPHLVDIIDQLLNGKAKAINKIFRYDISDKSTIDDKINAVNQEIIEIAPENIEERKEKLVELEELLKVKELNKNQKDIEIYYNELINLISFELIDTLLVNDLKRVEDFLELTLANRVIVNNTDGKTIAKIKKK